jgi:hypothetical protein
MGDRLIISAASPAYGPSLLALMGSLNLNWPDHPPVRVYDLGLEDETLAALAAAGITVVRVPAFVPHWRKHFAWKIWCWNEAPARDVLWIDAGAVVLKPLPEVFTAIERLGYFVGPSNQRLIEEASVDSCEGCGVPPEFREGKMSVAGTIVGFRKEGTVGTLVEEALVVASTERYIAASEPRHRHDQAVLSLLIYKHIGDPLMVDGLVYFGWESPKQTPGQKVWVHRRGLDAADQAHFAAHLAKPGPPHMPAAQPPSPRRRPAPSQWPGLAVHKVRQRLRGSSGDDGVPGFTVPYDGIRD